MESQNVSFTYENRKFNYRVAGFITNNSKVLLETSSKFWNMPGGRVQMGESSEEAIKRELLEEMSVVPKNITLIQVCENFFEWMGNHQQELLFVYNIEVNDDCELLIKDNFKCADASDKVFKWHDFTSVKKLNCLPTCIYDLVEQDNSKIHHTINK